MSFSQELEEDICNDCWKETSHLSSPSSSQSNATNTSTPTCVLYENDVNTVSKKFLENSQARQSRDKIEGEQL